MFKSRNCYCPACKSLLNLQAGFSPKNEKHMCTECGRIVNVMTGEFPQDEDEPELYYGDFSVKEGKYGESDNEKTAPIPEIPPEYMDAPPQEGYEDEGTPPPPPPQEDAPPPPQEQAAPDEEAGEDENSAGAVMGSLQKWKAEHKKPIMIAKLGMVAVAFIVAAALFLSNLIAIGYGSDQLQGMDRRTVAEMLERQGFKRVKVKALDDLGYDQIEQENIVRSVDVGDVSEFESTKHFIKWKKITIYYSSLQKKALPISSKDLKDVDYHELVDMLETAGFVNIKTEADPDLKTGWINFDGEVEEMFINNKNKFSADDKYRPDAEIIIKYHTFGK